MLDAPNHKSQLLTRKFQHHKSQYTLHQKTINISPTSTSMDKITSNSKSQKTGKILIKLKLQPITVQKNQINLVLKNRERERLSFISFQWFQIKRDRLRDWERERERERESQREKEREASKMKYLEGALDQGSLKAKAEAMMTDERSPMRGEWATTTSEGLSWSSMRWCAPDWTDLQRRVSDVTDLCLLAWTWGVALSITVQRIKRERDSRSFHLSDFR